MSPQPRRHRRFRAAGLLAAAIFALAACSPAPPSPSPAATPTGAPPTDGQTPGPSGTAVAGAETFADIRADVEAIRGLEPTADVEPVTIDETQLRANLEAEFDVEYDADELRTAEDTLAALGLIPVGSSLRQLTLDLQAGQVAGYYSPDKDELFVVSRTGATLGPVERVTYAHEFTHQLQDQHFDLDALGVGVADQSDRSYARLALVEGDATSVQSTWTPLHLTSADLGELLRASLDPVALEALRNAPAILRETALFPYQDGLAFVTRILSTGGYDAVDAAFADPPDSTEQVLHPDRYLQREPPVEGALPKRLPGDLGSGWLDAGQDTLGELLVRIWLGQGGVAGPQARTAADGWGGDRLMLLRGPDGAVDLAWRTEWDSAADAAEFATAAEAAIAGIGLEGRIDAAAGSKRVDVALGDEAIDILAALAG